MALCCLLSVRIAHFSFMTRVYSNAFSLILILKLVPCRPSPTGNPMSGARSKHQIMNLDLTMDADTPSSSRTFRQPSAILDFIWYPTASPRDPASFCFVASVRECPVKLLDASDGRVSEPVVPQVTILPDVCRFS